MLRRTYLLNRLIWPRDISFIVGRHPIVYIKVVIQYIAIIFLLFLVWRLLQTTFPWVQSFGTIFAIIVSVVYLLWVFLLLRRYFDVMVATKDHLYIVQRDSFFKYYLKILTRSSVQDISFSPTSHVGAVMKDATVLIATEQDERIVFDNVWRADEVARKMYLLRDAFLFKWDDDESEHEELRLADDEKFKVLVETLGEVIVDYMKKKED